MIFPYDSFIAGASLMANLIDVSLIKPVAMFISIGSQYESSLPYILIYTLILFTTVTIAIPQSFVKTVETRQFFEGKIDKKADV